MVDFGFRSTLTRGVLALASVTLAMGFVPGTVKAEEPKDSPLKAGVWAVGFDWIVDDGFYGTGSRSAVGLNVKRHTSPSTAFRVGVGLDLEETKQDGFDSDLGAVYPPPELANTDITTENHGGFVYVQWMTYKPVRDRMSVFLALGPSFGYSRRNSSDINDTPTRYSESSYGTTRRNVSLLGQLGFEWLFTKRLSLAGQVGTMAVYEWGNTDEYFLYNRTAPYSYRDGRRARMDFKGVRFRTGRATFMLTAYL